MRRIKPGLIASSVGGTAKRHERGSGASGESSRGISEELEESHKSKGRKTYSRTGQDRFVEEKKSRFGAPAQDTSGGAVDNYRPREDYEALEEIIGHSFSDRNLLERALTHRSALRGRDRTDYERLEFLGDAVLGLCVAHLLSDMHPDATEGKLSKMRAALVNTSALADIARKLDFGPFIRLGRGEVSSGGADRPSILADVTEAVFGAAYRDSSYDEVFQLVSRIFAEEIRQVTPYDPKTELQEVLHQTGSEIPSYLVELVEGPTHAPTFVVIVKVDGEIVGRGRGATKKGAQQAAAAEVLLRLIPSNERRELESGQNCFIEEFLLCQALEDDSTGYSVEAEMA
ncbi:MAG: ribonuclease III [bacterium]|nr:ribonuclease III [bacterium]